MERSMREEGATAEPLAAYSDAVFAVIVTVMVLELKAPAKPRAARSSSTCDRMCVVVGDDGSRAPIALCLAPFASGRECRLAR